MGRDHHQKECSCSPPVKHKPGSESLESVFCLEESSSSSPRSTDCNPERVFRERCLPRGKESSSSSFPLRHKTRLCAFLKNMNAAVLSLSDKVFLCPGLPASRKARVQSASARCLLGFDIFSSGSPTCSFVCHTLRASLAPHSGSSRIFLWFPPSSSPCNFARQSKIFQQSFPVWSSRLTRLRVSQRMKSRWSGICSRDSRGKALAAHRLALVVVVVVVVPPPQDSHAFFLLQDEERESGIPESSLTFKECRCPQRASERKAGERTRHLRIPLVVSSTLAAIKLVLGVRKARDSRGKRIYVSIQSRWGRKHAPRHIPCNEKIP